MLGFDRLVGLLIGLGVCIACVAACGSGDDSTFGEGSGGDASGTTPATGTFGGDGGPSTGTPGARPGNGNPELCDGIDNDDNGIIDDVDKGGDGICDCLKIATLGAPGRAGTGNVFSAWLDARSDFGAENLEGQVLTPELLAKFQVIVAQNLSTIGRAYAPSEVDALSAWVKTGGGFMTLIGYADPGERTNVNSLLAAYGMNYDAEQILKRQPGASTIPVTQWEKHPVTDGVTLLGVDNGYPVDGTGAILAREQGYNLLNVQEVGQGHVVMWGDEWITFDSEWSGHPDYQVERFWLNTIKWLTPGKQCQVALPPVK